MIDIRAPRLKTNRRVVLIGSMSVYAELLEYSKLLNSKGIQTVVPEPEDEGVQQLSLFEFETFKRRVSFAYLRKIRHPSTFCVLAINLDRHGILNYIGPNTFAEIAVAFAQSKKIYLLQAMPEAYADELSAWRVAPLRGNLETLVEDFRDSVGIDNQQLGLFD
jgi:hypothetical protein